MSDPDDDDPLDALLAQGRLSSSVRSRALEGALERVTAEDRARQQSVRRRWVWGLLSASAAVAVLVIVLVALPKQDDELRAKGGSDGPVVDILCGNATATRCARGDQLTFEVTGLREGGVLTAWAEPEPSGERIWYFGAPEPMQIPAGADRFRLPEGIRIGPEHAAGVYRIHLVLSRGPITRAEALAATPSSTATVREWRMEIRP